MFLSILFWTTGTMAEFFVVSDVHYDVFYNPKYNESFNCHSVWTVGQTEPAEACKDVKPVIRPFCDSSLEFISRTLAKMKEVDPDPEFILILGDVVGHYTSSFLNKSGEYDPSYNLDLIKETHLTFVEDLQKYFPNTQILPLIGNNDVYTDYQMPVGEEKNEFLEFLYSLWTPFIKEASDSFLEDGYYSAEAGGFKIILMNSILYSVKDTDENEGRVSQMYWLESELKESENVFIVMHIPPGFSDYGEASPDWTDRFTQAFVDLVKKNEDKIEAVFVGHFHFGDFQLIGSVPVIVSPSLSPIFGNNPAFRYFDWKGKNYLEYTTDSYHYVNQWKITSFYERYGYFIDYERLYADLATGVVTLENYLMQISGLWVEEGVSFDEACAVVFGPACDKGEEYLLNIVLCDAKYQVNKEFYACLEHQKID